MDLLPAAYCRACLLLVLGACVVLLDAYPAQPPPNPGAGAFYPAAAAAANAPYVPLKLRLHQATYNRLVNKPAYYHQQQQSQNHVASIRKRAAMSFNNDLQSIAALIQGNSNRRRLEAAQSFLSAIGKRSAEIAPRVDTYISRPETRAGAGGQASHGLSVGVSLEAIHDMIRAQRRRQSHDRARNAYDRLQIIGKRSVDGLEDSPSLQQGEKDEES